MKKNRPKPVDKPDNEIQPGKPSPDKKKRKEKEDEEDEDTNSSDPDSKSYKYSEANIKKNNALRQAKEDAEKASKHG